MRLDQSTHNSTGILFSGGVDSVVLTALAADILSTSLSTTSPPILHLYNVSFGPTPEKSADRKAALISYQTLQEKYSNNSIIQIIFHDIIVEWDDICNIESHIRTLLQPKSTVMDVNIAVALWYASKGDNEKTQRQQQDQ